MPDFGGGKISEKLLSLRMADVFVTLVDLLTSSKQEEEYYHKIILWAAAEVESNKFIIKPPAIRQGLLPFGIYWNNIWEHVIK